MSTLNYWISNKYLDFKNPTVQQFINPSIPQFFKSPILLSVIFYNNLLVNPLAKMMAAFCFKGIMPGKGRC